MTMAPAANFLFRFILTPIPSPIVRPDTMRVAPSLPPGMLAWQDRRAAVRPVRSGMSGASGTRSPATGDPDSSAGDTT